MTIIDAYVTPECPIIILGFPTPAEVGCGLDISEETVQRVKDAASKLGEFTLPPRTGNSIMPKERECIADHLEAIISQAFQDLPENDKWEDGLQLAAFGAFRFGLSFRRVSELTRSLESMRPGTRMKVRAFIKLARNADSPYGRGW